MTCEQNHVKFTVLEDDGNTIKIRVEKTMNGGLTVYPPGAGGSVLALTGATCSDGRDKGVGPQVNGDAKIWTFTKTNPSQPVYLRWTKRPNGTQNCGNTKVLQF